MEQKKCASCGKAINALGDALYCFSCDSIYCASCQESKMKKKDGNWYCEKCKTWKDIEGSLLFKQD